MSKIAIIGAGQVGATVAQMLSSMRACSEIALISRNKNKAKGIAIDIEHANPLHCSDVTVYGARCNDALINANIVIITSGKTRNPGMSRLDLMNGNKEIIDPILEAVMKYSANAFIIIVTNPVDVLTYYAWKKTGWNKKRIIGLSCVLDTARMTTILAKRTNCPVKDIKSIVIGGHGDLMIPLPEYSTIKGVPVNNILSKEEITNIVSDTRRAGTEIIKMKGTSGYIAASASIVKMTKAILYNKKQLLSCVCIPEGDYCLSDIAIGLPIIIGDKGIEKVVELDLTEEQMQQLNISANEIKEKIELLLSMDITYTKPVSFNIN